jgi:antitoxin PrlF
VPYSGRAIRSGNSQAMAFEKALFRAHPEFASGPLAADYIGPGHLLVRAVGTAEEPSPDDDPVLGAYLAFLEREMTAHPESLRPLNADSLARAQALVGHLGGDPDEDLGDDVSID